MKKFIFSLLTLCVSITVDAQSWIVDTIAGDELLVRNHVLAMLFKMLKTVKNSLSMTITMKISICALNQKYLILTVAVLQAVKWSEA